ncbi:MAG: hypothetical protein R2728_16120 [Chitinophagales bacterium]
MSLIYIPQITNRIKYVFNYVFKNYLQADINLIDDVALANGSEILISYKEPIANCKVYFAAHHLLFEETILPQEIECSVFNGHAIFFQVDDTAAVLPYDPFALIFYMLTRYEEYLPFDADEHGRFPAKASLAFQNNFLEDPIVEHAIADVLKCIQKVQPSFKYHQPSFQFEISFDVDAPFAYRGKGFFKNLFGGLSMLIKGKINQGIDRLGFTFFGGKDPFDQFYNILSGLDDYNLTGFFFLLLEHEGKHNPSIHYKHYALDILVEKLTKNDVVGIHPSYDCNTVKKLKEEQDRFLTLTHSNATISRQHFIRIKFPETYQLLQSAKIEHDYSMAFPDHMGFRAGCSRPYPFYDLSKESLTDITIHPFCVMDATFEYYLKMDSDKAIMEYIKMLYNKVYLANGVFHIVFHNDLISTYLSKHNWKKILEEVLAFNHTKTHGKSVK